MIIQPDTHLPYDSRDKLAMIAREKERQDKMEPPADASWMTTEYPESDAALNIVGIALAAIGLFGAGFFLALLLF